MDHAARGDVALQDGKLGDAVDYYTKALSQNPSAASWLIKRSAAYQRQSRHSDALRDAEAAVLSATNRARRELIAEAQLRRAIALFRLGYYGDSQFVFDIVERLTPKEKSLGMWKAQVTSHLYKLSESDHKRRVTVKEMPEIRPAQPPIPSDISAPVSISRAIPTQTAAHSIRHDWYQNSETVTFTLLAKGVPKDKASIEIRPRSLNISFPLSTEPSYDFNLDPLYAEVDPTHSHYRVLSTKIEVVLKKASSGNRWPSIERTSMADTANPQSGSSGAPLETGPSYPTSSRSGPKNWELIAQSFHKPKGSDKNESDGREASKKEAPIYIDDELDEVSDPANAFFQKLYQNSDPDTRRAMMKSFQESGGTTLNTNWDQVKQNRVAVSPPTGMEEKKFEY